MGRTTKRGEPPDMRTLDDPEPKIDWSPILAPQELRADALRIGGDWVLRPARPNVWRRFWMWALLGWKWERGD